MKIAEPLDLNVIKAILRHREPFLFVNSIEHLSNDTIEASLKVYQDEFFLKGHFPGDPMIPGVLLIEAMAQTAGFLIAYNLTKEKGVKPGSVEYDFFLSKVNSVKFQAKIIPPALLRIKAKTNPSLIENFYETTGRIYVNDEPKATGSLTLYLKMKNNLKETTEDMHHGRATQ